MGGDRWSPLESLSVLGQVLPRTLRAGATIVIVLLTVGLLLLELLAVTETFFVPRAFLAGFTSGALLLALGILVIDATLASRDRRRWHRVVAVAYRALANEAGDTRKRLDELVFGRPHRAAWWPVADTTIAAERLLARGAPGLSPERGDREDRLRVLAGDARWRANAWQGVRNVKRLGWASVAHWAPVMLSSSRSAVDVDRLAGLNDEVARLQMLLDDDIEVSPPDPESIAAKWAEVAALATELEDHLLGQVEGDSVAGKVLAVHRTRQAAGFKRDGADA